MTIGSRPDLLRKAEFQFRSALLLDPALRDTTLRLGRTLVLALGVGVLIGRSGNHGSSSKNPVQVIRVGGGTAAAAGAATTTAKATKSAATKSKKSTAKKAAKLKQANPGAAVAGGKDAAKQHLPPPTVKVGQPGHGRGYKNGKFTGDFFGQ